MKRNAADQGVIGTQWKNWSAFVQCAATGPRRFAGLVAA